MAAPRTPAAEEETVMPKMCRVYGPVHKAGFDQYALGDVVSCPECAAIVRLTGAANQVPSIPAHQLGEDGLQQIADDVLPVIGPERVQAWLDRQSLRA